jgi:hypothetical protein
LARPDTIKPDSNFVPGRVGRCAELAAQARPYVLGFGPGRHDGPTGPSGCYRARSARSNLFYAVRGSGRRLGFPVGRRPNPGGAVAWREREGEVTAGRRCSSSMSPWSVA